MASEEEIRFLIDDCLVYCRNTSTEDKEAAVGQWARWFSNTPLGDLEDAVYSWIEDLPREGPNPSLPRFSELRSRMSRPPAPPDRNPGPFNWPSREFVAAMGEFREGFRAIYGHRIFTIGTSPDQARYKPPHRHEDPAKACQACAMEDAQAERRRALEALYLALPEPAPEPARPCKCDGSGWRDPAATMELLGGLDLGHREVYPCSECRPELYARWVDARDEPIGAA